MHIAHFQLVTICSLMPVLHLIFYAIPASSQWSRRGGVGNFGVKFFHCCFCLLWSSYMPRGGEKCN